MGFRLSSSFGSHLTALWSKWRYLKFGLVGAGGTLVNLGVLYVCQEFVLQGIDATQRLYASLALAIVLATVNNFYWNRRWTWRDRTLASSGSAWHPFWRYCLASWLGTCVQYVLTLWLATHMHYMPANVLAIGVASFVNYFANDWWTFQAQPRVVPLEERRARYERVSLMLLLLAGVVYAFDLGGENIPRNGDEMVYAHIAFKTWLQAQHTGAWLPLASDLGHMRNTKPPLLFWQAMSVGWLGLDWQLFWLRLPSLLYTALTTACVVWATRALALARTDPRANSSASVLTPNSLGYVAGLFFLAFFSTYRYGRPYLTSAMETFWMSLPMWVLLKGCIPTDASTTSDDPAARHTSRVFGVAALSMGAVALYKSFVLIVPMAGALFLALCWLHPHAWRRWFVATTVSVCVGVACFGLWLVLDPDPQSVWREFVVGENLGKMNQGGPSYWRTALLGGFSIWWQALALPQNALLLAPMVLWVLGDGLRHAPAAWAQWRNGQRAHATSVLWWHVLVVSAFFMLPSQRSSRYLIPLMPMVAVLCALHIERGAARWHRLALGASALLSLIGLSLLGLFLWAGIRIDLYPLWGRMGLYLMLVLQVLALWRVSAAVWRASSGLHTGWIWMLGWVISLYAWFGMLSAPLHSAGQQYSRASQQRVAGLRLAVPSYFNGDFERWRFLLPPVAHIQPYPADDLRADETLRAQDTSAPLKALLASHDAVVVHTLWNEPAPDCATLGCDVVQQRVALRGRHKPGDITPQALHTPEALLFWREYLLARH